MEGDRVLLAQLAETVMRNNGLQPDIPDEVLTQVAGITTPLRGTKKSEDLRALPWCSIDNEDSRDLDQLTYGEQTEKGETFLFIAIADVSSLVPKNSPIDRHAKLNTTSVYTPAKIFPMLPEELCYDKTSLNMDEERLALVVQVKINHAAEIESSSIFQGVVRNQAKLSYPLVGSWLEGKITIPEKVKKTEGLERSLKCQHRAAQMLRAKRFERGSLTLEPGTLEPKVKWDNTILIEGGEPNVAHQLIEELMIVANQTMAFHFKKAGLPILSRVVRTPKRWERIVEIADQLHETLPSHPDSRALNHFLSQQKQRDPLRFPDLSLAVIKLLGRGEYIVKKGSDKPIGHFGLALVDYTHSTAPNRRFPDLLVQRLYKAYLNQEPSPYTLEELHWLAHHCTQQEDAALKVERHLNKSAAAVLLSTKIGTLFSGMVTGSSEKGSWVRIFNPHIEGKLVQGFEKVDVGDRITVRLVHVDVNKGHIDFELARDQ